MGAARGRHAEARSVYAIVGANPFTHFGADLGDVLVMGLSVTEMVNMQITFQQLVAHGMDARTEQMFKLGEDEWKILGKK